MRRYGDTFSFYSLIFSVIVLIVSGLKICTFFPSLRFLSYSAIMICGTNSIITIRFSPIQSLCFNAIYPNDSTLLFYWKIKHWSRTRTDKCCSITVSFPPFSCHSTIEKSCAWTGITLISRSGLDVNNINLLIDIIIKIKRRYPLLSQLLIN